MAGLIQRNRRVSAHSAQRATITVAAVLLSALGSAGAASAPYHGPTQLSRARGPASGALRRVTKSPPGRADADRHRTRPRRSPRLLQALSSRATSGRLEIISAQRRRRSTPRDGGSISPTRRGLGGATATPGRGTDRFARTRWGGLIAAAYAARAPAPRQPDGSCRRLACRPRRPCTWGRSNRRAGRRAHLARRHPDPIAACHRKRLHRADGTR